MNWKKPEALQSLRMPANGVQIAGALFWLVVLTASFARQFLQTRHEAAAPQGEDETERTMYDRADEFDDDPAVEPMEAS